MTTTLITGASSGIGEAFANTLAAKGNDLILVARSQDKLQAIAQRLHSQHDIRTEVIVQDLAHPDGASTVFQKVNSLGIVVDVLINNAGFGDYGAFGESDRTKQLDMIRLNILTLTDLTHLFLPNMVTQKSGHIINIASIAAFQPMPYLSVYAATKAFVLSFSEALWAEVKADGIKVLALCPGPTDTQFFQVANFSDTMSYQAPQMMTSDAVVQEALKAMDAEAPSLVNGGPLNQLIVNLPRFMPRAAIVNLLEKQFRSS
ncbi:MAG: SDR family oxidoreductase [Cyanobacteria bacterium P01_F01_bin.150]